MTRVIHLTFRYGTILFLVLTFVSCNTNSSDVKFKQYYLKGEQIYLSNCSNCHQKNGAGLGLLFPPLNTSDYMERNLNDVVCLIKNGTKGEMVVNGKRFNHEMPSFHSLSPIEMAELTTYIYNTWSHKRGIIEVKEVTDMLSRCADKPE